MGSEMTLRVPTIDFTKPGLKPGTQVWESARTQVQQALEEFGCFEAVYGKVSLHLMNSIYTSLEELFNLPLETKLKNIPDKPFHGYLGQYPLMPLYESMGIDDAGNPQSVETFTQTLWPQGNPTFSKTIDSFSEQLSELDQMVRRMILEALGVDKYLHEHLNSTQYLLRLMKYKAPETKDTKLGLGSHTDRNTLTILCQNQVDGLEVQTKDGDWLKIKPTVPNSFIVMIGDSLYAWTNGRLHVPYHRVMMTGDEARYSLAFISRPNGGYLIKAPEELVDEEHPLLFKPFEYVDFLKFSDTEAAGYAQFPLKAYCGV